jgi:hypothetical protein
MNNPKQKAKKKKKKTTTTKRAYRHGFGGKLTQPTQFSHRTHAVILPKVCRH